MFENHFINIKNGNIIQVNVISQLQNYLIINKILIGLKLVDKIKLHFI